MDIYIVIRDKILCRAFPTEEDAIRYRDNKIKILHDHCCLCECDRFRTEHVPIHRIPVWNILKSKIDESNPLAEIYISDTKEIKKKYLRFSRSDDLIKVVKYSPSCLYQEEGKEIEVYRDDNVNYQLVT